MIQDLERLVWIHFSVLPPPPRAGTTVDKIGDRWELSRFGDRILAREGQYRAMLQFERHKKPKKLSSYNFPSCTQLLTALKQLHPLEALADI